MVSIYQPYPDLRNRKRLYEANYVYNGNGFRRDNLGIGVLL